MNPCTTGIYLASAAFLFNVDGVYVLLAQLLFIAAGLDGGEGASP